MARFRTLKNSFLSGEISPKLHRNVQINEFGAGLAEQLNQVTSSTGGSFTRPGLRFLNAFTTFDFANENAAIFDFSTPENEGRFLIVKLKSGGDYTTPLFWFVKSSDGETITTDSSSGWSYLDGVYHPGVSTAGEVPWDTELSAMDFNAFKLGNHVTAKTATLKM